MLNIHGCIGLGKWQELVHLAPRLVQHAGCIESANLADSRLNLNRPLRTSAGPRHLRRGIAGWEV